MALDSNRLGDAMMATADAVIASHVGQSSDPVNAANYRRALWRGLAADIINEFKNNATIQPLTVTMTPNDGAPHVHAPSTTDSATGKIS